VRAALDRGPLTEEPPLACTGHLVTWGLFVSKFPREGSSVPFDFAPSEDSINRVVLAVTGLSLVGVGVSIELVTWKNLT
jgi:hypothetical protein